MSSRGMPYEQAHVYCCSDTLSFPLKGKVAARGRFLFIISALLGQQALASLRLTSGPSKQTQRDTRMPLNSDEQNEPLPESPQNQQQPSESSSSSNSSSPAEPSSQQRDSIQQVRKILDELYGMGRHHRGSESSSQKAESGPSPSTAPSASSPTVIGPFTGPPMNLQGLDSSTDEEASNDSDAD